MRSRRESQRIYDTETFTFLHSKVNIMTVSTAVAEMHLENTGAVEGTPLL